jgi:hypothetical protein
MAPHMGCTQILPRSHRLQLPVPSDDADEDDEDDELLDGLHAPPEYQTSSESESESEDDSHHYGRVPMSRHASVSSVVATSSSASASRSDARASSIAHPQPATHAELEKQLYAAVAEEEVRRRSVVAAALPPPPPAVAQREPIKRIVRSKPARVAAARPLSMIRGPGSSQDQGRAQAQAAQPMPMPVQMVPMPMPRPLHAIRRRPNRAEMMSGMLATKPAAPRSLSPTTAYARERMSLEQYM